MPSFEGGGEWGGPAIDPTTHILYINANNYASIGGLAVHSGDSPGRATYLSQCSICHGEHRAGTTEFPSLLNITHKLTTEQITTVIHDGKGRMPASPNLQGAKLTALLDYLRTEKDLAPINASEEQTSSTTKTSEPRLESGPARIAGAHVYQTNCAICHGDKREGIAPSFPALIGVGDRYTDAQILALIHNGKGRMPPITKLSQNDLDDLMRFLHPLNAEATTTSATDPSATQYFMTGYRRFLDPDGYPAVATPWGTLNALDLNTGKYLWRIPLGQYPELVAKGMPDTGTENYGGPIVTAGGLLFIGATNFDKKFRAFDKSTGKLLWETTLPFAANATPATYEVNGRQYVIIAAGGSTMNPRGPIGGVYIAFALPR
jgi:mono/diheme cytochrome c family protein